MNRLQDYALYDISWNLSPEHAVTMYLEWGNNDWHSEYPPVRSKEDVSHYFVVDSWGKEPVIRLVRLVWRFTGFEEGMKKEGRYDVNALYWPSSWRSQLLMAGVGSLMPRHLPCTDSYSGSRWEGSGMVNRSSAFSELRRTRRMTGSLPQLSTTK